MVIKVLILGNHDKKVPDHLKVLFSIILLRSRILKFKKNPYIISYIKDLEVIMCHFPMLSWEHKKDKRICYDTRSLVMEKVDQINTDSKELRVDVGIDGNLANYDLISLEKLANHLIKIEKDNKHGMVK